MNKKCIYLYSDILGYKDLISKNSVQELKEITESILTSIERLIEIESKKEHSILAKFSQFQNPLKSGNIKLYFAFDTIVLYWEKFDSTFNWKEYDAFLNLVSIIYLELLTQYGILIRGVISESENYFIDERIFIIKEIEKSYLVEKNQNWSNIIISLPGVYDITNPGLPMDDPYKKIECDNIPFKEEIWAFVNIQEKKRKYEELFVTPNLHIHVLNQINATTVKYLNEHNIDIKKSIKNLNNVANSHEDENARIKIINTIRYIEERIRQYEWYTIDTNFIDENVKQLYEKLNTPHNNV